MREALQYADDDADYGGRAGPCATLAGITVYATQVTTKALQAAKCTEHSTAGE
jgi:hypothetical protein